MRPAAMGRSIRASNGKRSTRRLTYEWGFTKAGADVLISVCCPGDGLRLYQHTDYIEVWDGARAAHTEGIFTEPSAWAAAAGGSELFGYSRDHSRFLAEINAHGVAAMPRVLSEAEVAALRDAEAAYMAAVLGDGPFREVRTAGIGLLEPEGTPRYSGQSYFIHGLHNKGRAFEALVQHPLLL